ncbi:MAG TPA: hypothetical protein VJQ47_18720 [Steroidobacteraceae bacterium]|nr:hypothetical protein [Steroidobacteraceae bacterium]
MKRMDELQARRRALLAQCESQRIELAYRIAQLRPGRQMANWTRRAPLTAANHPLAWLAGLAGIFLMLRPRRLMSWLTWTTGAVSLASRATTLLRLLSQVRDFRTGFKAGADSVSK